MSRRGALLVVLAACSGGDEHVAPAPPDAAMTDAAAPDGWVDPVACCGTVVDVATGARVTDACTAPARAA